MFINGAGVGTGAGVPGGADVVNGAVVGAGAGVPVGVDVVNGAGVGAGAGVPVGADVVNDGAGVVDCKAPGVVDERRRIGVVDDALGVLDDAPPPPHPDSVTATSTTTVQAAEYFMAVMQNDCQRFLS